MKTSIKLGFLAEIKISVNGEIERDGIKAPSNDLHVFGNLEYEFLKQEINGKLGMRGMWRKAFGVKWLAIGNIFFGYGTLHLLLLTINQVHPLFFSITITVPSPVPLTGVQFGGRLEFGYDCLVDDDFALDVSTSQRSQRIEMML